MLANLFAYCAYFWDFQRLIDLTPTAAGTAVEKNARFATP
jgi:hypothetical protein